jgi:hypothetical protein
MSSKIRIVTAVALAVLTGLTLVAAQEFPPLSRSEWLEARQAVEVEVLDAHRKGIPDTSVSLTDLVKNREAKRGTTDSNGRVLFYKVPESTYRLNISGPGIEDPRSVVFVTPGSRWFQDWLPVVDGKPVKIQSTPCRDCGGPGPSPVLDDYSPLPTSTYSIEDHLSLPPLPAPLPPQASSPQRRNLIGRFFSHIGHKLRSS